MSEVILSGRFLDDYIEGAGTNRGIEYVSHDVFYAPPNLRMSGSQKNANPSEGNAKSLAGTQLNFLAKSEIINRDRQVPCSRRLISDLVLRTDCLLNSDGRFRENES
jgi:hypothetical protein